MAKNITPIVGKNYAIFSVDKQWITFKVKSICGDTVYVEWTSPTRYAPEFNVSDFTEQLSNRYHILELNKPEDLLIHQFKYTS